jgi:hypothetical protein
MMMMMMGECVVQGSEGVVAVIMTRRQLGWMDGGEVDK